ncbi:hypothetical protein XPN_0545 [Xanthomonas arboricola pv. pruni MAFF 301427]|nr:hypothetical protein XPN_0545 [Xanthomonas arboricola pv. pruni MAFF 301427]
MEMKPLVCRESQMAPLRAVASDTSSIIGKYQIEQVRIAFIDTTLVRILGYPKHAAPADMHQALNYGAVKLLAIESNKYIAPMRSSLTHSGCVVCLDDKFDRRAAS